MISGLGSSVGVAAYGHLSGPDATIRAVFAAFAGCFPVFVPFPWRLLPELHESGRKTLQVAMS